MGKNSDDEVSRSLIPRATVPANPELKNPALRVNGPVQSLVHDVRRRAGMRAMQTEIQWQKTFGQLIDTVAETTGKLHAAQSAALKYAARQEVASELFEAEKTTQLDEALEARDESAHRRAIAKKRRETELIKAKTEQLLAEQEHRAKKKFEKLKHAAGEARFEAKVADRQVGTAVSKEAIAKTQAPAVEPAEPSEQESPTTDNESEFVLKIYALIKNLQERIRQDEGEGKDTTALRRQLDGLKMTLDLV